MCVKINCVPGPLDRSIERWDPTQHRTAFEMRFDLNDYRFYITSQTEWPKTNPFLYYRLLAWFNLTQWHFFKNRMVKSWNRFQSDRLNERYFSRSCIHFVFTWHVCTLQLNMSSGIIFVSDDTRHKYYAQIETNISICNEIGSVCTA